VAFLSLRFKTCPKSQVCVPSELFCDGRVNCAWPDGDRGDDERKCSEYHLWKEGGGERVDADGGGVFSAGNIPVIIVIVVAAFGGCVLLAVGARNFYRSVKPPSPSSASSSSSRRRGRTRRASPSSAAPPLLASPTAPSAELAGEVPSAPPSYDEVMSGNSRENPPPYSPKV